MAVSRVAVTTGAPASAAAFAITLPTNTTRDRLILIVTGKDQTTTVPTINQGWTLLKSGTGGTGTNAADTGQMFWAVYGKDAVSATETAPTVTPGATAPNTWTWICSSHRNTSGSAWRDAIATTADYVQSASDTTTATPVTGTAGAFTNQPTTNDALFIVGAGPTDLGSAQTATPTITATGLSGGTKSTATSQYVENSFGNDCYSTWMGWTGFTGPASAGVAVSYGITSATDLSGVIVVVALREIAMPTPAVVSATTTIPALSGTIDGHATVWAQTSIPTPTVTTGGSSATATPSVVAATTTVPSPTISIGQTVPATVVNAVTTVPSPAITAGGSVTATPAVVNATTAVGSAVVSTGSKVSPAVVSVAATVGAPTVGAGAGVTPAVVAVVTTIPTMSGSSSSTLTPAVVSAVTSIPTPTVTTSGNATATPAVVAVVTSIPAPTLHTGETVTPAVVAATTTVPAPTVQTGETVTPAVVAAVTAIPAPTITAGTGVVVTPAVVPVVTTVPAPTVTAGGSVTVTPPVVAVSTTVPAPTLHTGETVTPAVVAAVTTIPTPGVTAGGNATATPGTVNATTTVASPSVSVGVRISALVLAASVAIAVPVIHSDTTPTPVRVSVVTTIPTPTITAGSSATVTPSTVAVLSTIPAPVVAVSTSATVHPATVGAVTSIYLPVVTTGSAAPAADPVATIAHNGHAAKLASNNHEALVGHNGHNAVVIPSADGGTVDVYAVGDRQPPFTCTLMDGAKPYDATAASNVTVKVWQAGVLILNKAATTVLADGTVKADLDPTTTSVAGPYEARVLVDTPTGQKSFPPDRFMSGKITPATP